MPNMSYFRFTNTYVDLQECLDSIRQDECLSDFEVQAGRNMFKTFLTFCRGYDIIDSYDAEIIDELFRSLEESAADENDEE